MNNNADKEEYIYDLTENERMMIAYFRLLDEKGKSEVENLVKKYHPEK